MELSDLRVFAAVVEQGTTTKAAKLLGMTQPGASKHLSRLEHDIGGALFSRTGKYLILNDFGRFFFEKVKGILRDIESLSELTYGAVCPLGSLKIGLTDAATLIITPPSLVEFRKRYPGVHITLDVDSSTHVEERVLDGQYDLGFITAGKKLHPHLEQEALYDDYIDAVVALDHPLAERKRVTLKELVEHTLIMSPKRRRTRAIIDEVFHLHDIQVTSVIDVYIHTAALRLAEGGLGIALLPRAFINDELLRQRCVHLRISGDPIRRTMCIVSKRTEELSAAAQCFYSIVMKEKQGSYSLNQGSGKVSFCTIG